MGEMYSLMNGLYQYELPKPPSDEKLILFHDLPKKDQYWGSPLDKNQYHIIKDVRKMTERERVEYIHWNRMAWLEGIWMFINGEPTYITGMHFDFLKFCKFEDFSGKADYLDQQRLDFYFRDLVRKDPRTYGQVILKCRRAGVTSEDLCQGQYTLLEDDNNKIGLQSNELMKKCIPELLTPFINMYVRRPSWIREEYQKPNGKKPVGSLKLTSNKATDDEDGGDEEINGLLGGTVMAYPTLASAMDGSKKEFITMDEIFKWTTASAYDTLGVNQKCVVEYGIKGKIGMLSTMGDSDAAEEAVKEGCRLYNESDPTVRDANGRTTSGMYKWFISAIHSADVPQEHRDLKYGKVNEERALEYIWGEVNKHPKDSKNYVFALRRLPPEEKYAMLAANEKTYFDIIRIQSRLNDLYKKSKNDKPYVRGRLEELFNGKVIFEPDEEGHWLMAVQPFVSAEKNIDTRNRFRKNNEGVFFPPINPEWVGGYDQVRLRTDHTVSKNLSQAAIYFYKAYDYYMSGEVHEWGALYLHRPEEPEIAHREAIKGCKFFGAPMAAERSVETTYNEFERLNMVPFLLKSKDNIWGFVSSQKATENGVQKLVTHFSTPKMKEQKDMVEAYPFEVGLEDLKNFDLKKTTTSHCTMSKIMVMNALDQTPYTNMTEQVDTTAQDVLAMINPVLGKNSRLP